MSASAADIITYIGVPLAVLGVLPIIYTCVRAILVLRSIRQALALNGHSDSAVTRGSMMSGIVEVELPRCTITPLDRHHDAEYWKLNSARSSLKGGSWTFFHWNRLVTGKKLYRIQYKDELRVPQAEIEFDELLAFLLDRGAVPDETGWSMLRTSGLWTPTGTVLLKAPLGQFGGVLRIGVPDDSDGVLSLKVHWQSEWDKRGPDSLPPFWMRIHQPQLALDLRESEKPLVDVENDETNTSGSAHVEEECRTSGNPVIESDSPAEDSEAQDPELPILSIIEKEKRALLGPTNESNSVRFQLQNNAVNRIYFEHDGMLTGDTQDMAKTPDIVKQWFASAVSSLNKDDKSGTWHFSFPSHIPQSVSRDAIPCGVMVLLDIMSDGEVPPWCSPRPTTSPFNLSRRFLDDVRQKEVEKTMPPAQAEASRRARESANMWSVQEEHMQFMKRLREYEEQRVGEALVAPRLKNKAVAEACVAWLVRLRRVPEGYKVADLAQAVVYLMMIDLDEAKVVAELCDRWMIWGQANGMSRTDLTFLLEHKTSFCYASALVYTVQLAAKSEVRVSTDMQECLDVWRKVRLG